MHLKRLALLAALMAGTAYAQPDPYAAWNEATVYRDDWGVPHVYAENPRALGFAFGYAQAEDHLEPMLLAYRYANGRAAEVQGEAYAQSDDFALKMGHATLALEAWAQADDVTVNLCEGFAQGVNAWIVEHPQQTPEWAEGVRPADILALLHCYLMSMAPFDLPNVFRPTAPSFSGNAWAVAPVRSATGEALLAINPHMYFEGPFRWYEAHLVCEDLDVSGATLFGLPVILQGHNDSLGWALTPNRPDFADVYAEPEFTIPRNPKSVSAPQYDPEAVLYLKIASSSRTYYVQTASGLEPRTAPCLFTSRGPVVGEDRGRLCSYRVGGYSQFGALRQFVEMGRARNLESFQAALTLQQIPCFHVVYADRAGNIFYLYNAVVGDKAVAPPDVPGEDRRTVRAIDWNAPVPGDNPLYGWGDTVPVTALPAITNPPAGYVQACGNPPWLATDDSGIDPATVPPWFALDEDSYRARRARQLLRLGARSFDEMQSMLYDALAPFALEAVPALLDAADAQEDFVAQAHPDLPVGLDLLRSWSYTADTPAAGMTFFHVWWMLMQEAVASNFRSPVQLMDAIRARTPELQEVSLRAADEAAKRMRNEYQNLTVPWGDVHRIRRGEREEALPGAPSGDPLFLTSDLRLESGKWTANYGYGFAMVVRFGETPDAVSMVPFGSSETPGSPHYADQLDLMLQRRFKPSYFRQDDVLLHAQSGFGRRILLHPAGMDGQFLVQAPTPIRAGLDVMVEPPQPLPDGLGTFTVYAKLRDVAADAAMAVEMQVRVPPEVCDEADLEELAVYACDGSSWSRLEEQGLESGAFSARDEQPRTYAVLGPVRLRKTEDVKSSNVPAPPSSDPEFAAILKPSTAEFETEAAEVATTETPPPLVPAGTQIAKAPEKPMEAPPVAPGVPAPAPETVTAKAEPPIEATPEAPEAMPEAPATEVLEAPAPAETAVAKAEPAAPPPATATQETLVINDQALDALQAQPKKEASATKPAREEKSLADIKPTAFGPPVSGTDLSLWTPDMKSMFLLTAKVSIQGRLVELPEAPGRLPEGLAVFSTYIGLERIPPDAKGDLALKLVVPEAVCAAENLSRLRLYGFREGSGWYEVKGQKVLTEERAVTALDRIGKGLRVYAVLGPVELRK